MFSASFLNVNKQLRIIRVFFFFPVETRESRHNSRNATWFPRHPKMRPLPPTASQEKSHVPSWSAKRYWHPWCALKCSSTHQSDSRRTPRFPAPLHLGPFSPPDRDRRVDSPVLSWRGSHLSRCISGWGRSHEDIRDIATWMVTHAERPRFPGPLLIRSWCPDTSLKITLLMKAQHLGALTPLGIVRRNPQVPHTAHVGDSGFIPRLGRSPEDENGHPLQYSFRWISWTEEPGGLPSTRPRKSQTRLSN